MKKECGICGKNTNVTSKILPYTEVSGKNKAYDYFSCCDYIKQANFLDQKQLKALYSSGYSCYKRSFIHDVVNLYFTSLRTFKYREYIKEKDILELGCGMGNFIAASMRYSPNIAEGVEISKYACNFIKKKYKIHVYNSDIESFKSNKKYDTIFLFQVIEHVKDPFKIINKCKSLLKKDGTIIIETPNLNSFDKVIFGENWFNYSVPYHTHLFSIKSFHKIAKRLNLSVDGVSSSRFPNTLSVQFKNINGILSVFLPFIILVYVVEYFISSLFVRSGIFSIKLSKT